MKLDWFALNIRDYERDTRDLTLEQHGVYLKLLMLAYERDGAVPGDDATLNRCAFHLHARSFQAIVKPILERFFARSEEGSWRHRRVDKELEFAGKRSRKQSENALNRWRKNAKETEISNENNAADDATAMPTRARLQTTTTSKRVAKAPLLEFGEADASLVETSAVSTLADRVARNAEIETIQTVVGLWNGVARDFRLPLVRDITAPRQASILSRSRDLVRTYDFADALSGWRALLAKVRGSPFLRGEKGFRCDLDFVVRAASFTKIMEGKYDESEQGTNRR